ncbi:MAG: hypothetical protein ACYDG4_13120 [Desulfuromonadaceae bacterium]
MRVNESNGRCYVSVGESLADQSRWDLPNIIVRAFKQELLEKLTPWVRLDVAD